MDIFGFKRFGWEINLRIIRPELKKFCEYKPAIVRLPQLVCKCQI